MSRRSNFGAIFRYEIGYRLRSPATWFFAALLFLGPAAMMHLSSSANGRVVNMPIHYAEVIGVLGIVAMFVTAGIFGDAATRDSTTGAQALFDTAPITKGDYLGGRFAASLLINAVILLGPPLGVGLSTLSPLLSHFNFAPFQLGAYVQPFLLFTIPNLLITAAVLYTIAALSRQTLAMYLGALGLLVAYLVVINQGLGSEALETLVDPFGLGALDKLSRQWTPAEQETRLIGYPPLLLASRVLWMTLSLALLVFLHARFNFTTARLGTRRRSLRAPAERGDETVRHAIVTVPRAAREFGARTHLAQTMAVARHALVDILRNRAFLFIALGAVVLEIVMAWDVGNIVFDTSTWPVTHLIAGEVLGTPMTMVFSVLTSIVAGELVWKERDTGAGDLAAITPVPDWVPFAGRYVALVAILVMMQALLMAAGVALQAVQGYYRFELGLYVRILFGMNLVGYLIFAALAMAVHVVLNNKNLAHVVVVATFLFTLVAGAFFSLRHNLLVFNGSPGWIYSDLNGFGPFVAPWAWFKAYWAAWALLLTVIATLFWTRSREAGWSARVRLARIRLAGAAGRAAAVAALLIVALGGFVFYNTNVLNAYRTPDIANRERADYERRFKRFATMAQPAVVATDLRVEIHPERRTADMGGVFHLMNLTSRPIDTVLVQTSREVVQQELSLSRPATVATNELALQRRVYVLAQPLQPGDSMTMTFRTSFAPRGFPNSNVPTDVVANGAYFDNSWLPRIGYQATQEVLSDGERKKQGLPPRVGQPTVRDSAAWEAARFDATEAAPVRMDVTIGTTPDQIAVTPGRLVREWRENGRRYFHYRTDEPIPNGTPFLSARYAMKEDAWTDTAAGGTGRTIPLRIYYHPTHTFNVDRIMHGLKASVDYYSAAWGPYPYGELRVVEFPRYASFARANPHTITFSEGSAFITRIDSGDVDRPFFVVAHETAHQWWGNQLRGARAAGGGLLTESLAQYGAMMVMEKTYGPEMVRRFYDFEMERYLSGRASLSSREVPLAEVDMQSHLFYHKGAVALYTLREMIGENAMNLALRRFLAAYGDATPPYATAPDMMKELRAVTPDSLQYVLVDLFDTITLWNVKTDSASAERTSNGDWRITLDVTAKKMRADSTGKETETPMNDLVELGVYAESTGDRRGPELYLQRHRVRSGRQRIVVTLPAVAGKEPARAGLDPSYKLIERDQEAALVKVARRDH